MWRESKLNEDRGGTVCCLRMCCLPLVCLVRRTPNSLVFLMLSVLLSYCTTGWAEEMPLIVPLKGKPVPARLFSIEGDRATFLDRANVERPLDLRNFVRWGSLRNPTEMDQVVLTDHSLLIGRVSSVTRGELVLQTDVWGQLTLSRTKVAAVFWHLPSGRNAQWKFRDDVLATESKADTVTLVNGDVLTGKLLTGDGERLRCSGPAGEIPLMIESVAACRLGQTSLAEETSGTHLLGLSDGSQLVASEARLDFRLQLRLACSVSLISLAEVQPVDEQLVCFYRPSGTQVTFVDQLAPLGYKHIPWLEMKWDWQARRNVLQGPLCAGDQLFDRGVGMHSTSRLAYQLNGEYSEFQAEACVDHSAGKKGSVVFHVFVTQDGTSWKEAYKSGIVRGGEAPNSLRVDVSAARGLALVVDFADWGDQLDHANWIGARLIPSVE